MSIYKDCDVRGIYEKELTATDCFKIGRALADMSRGKILVGGDVRLSTPELKAALLNGLLSSGADVVDLGTIPTPALYYNLKQTQAQAGCTVTASHNPPEYNGVKFMLSHRPVSKELIGELKSRVLAESFADGTGTLTQLDGAKAYADSFPRRFSASKPLHVLVDAGNGAMSDVAPEVFRRCGYRVTELYCRADGSFPNRNPNPAEYACLAATGEAVRRCGADFGVAFDGDGDRAVFLDEKGRPVQNEKSLVLFIRSILKNKPTPVVYDQKSSSIIRDAILQMGGTPLPEKSGHAYIKKRFLDNNASIAGEVSGHFFFGELGYDDGLFAALRMAELIAEAKQPLSELADGIICPPITPDIRFPCAYALQQERLDAVEKMAVEKGAQISRLDGVRADFPDAWFLMRKSVTAEQLTLRAEAQTPSRLSVLLEEIALALPEEYRSYLKA